MTLCGIDFGSVADLLTGIGTFGLMIAAFVGIRAWRVEAIGRHEIELARRYLARTYEARDRLRSVLMDMNTIEAFFGDLDRRKKMSVTQRQAAYAVKNSVQHNDFFFKFLADKPELEATFRNEPFDFLDKIPNYYLDLIHHLKIVSNEDIGISGFYAGKFNREAIELIIAPSVDFFDKVTGNGLVKRSDQSLIYRLWLRYFKKARALR